MELQWQTDLDLSSDEMKKAASAAEAGIAGIQGFIMGNGWKGVSGRYDAYGQTAAGFRELSRCMKQSRKALDAFLDALSEPNCPAVDLSGDIRDALTGLAATALHAAAVAGLVTGSLYRMETGAGSSPVVQMETDETGEDPPDLPDGGEDKPVTLWPPLDSEW